MSSSSSSSQLLVRNPRSVMDQSKRLVHLEAEGTATKLPKPRTVRANWWTQRSAANGGSNEGHESLAIAMEYVLEFQDRPGSQA